MEPSDLSALARVLEVSGPYGLVAILWVVNSRTASALQVMHEQVVEFASRQTEAITKVESALVALKEAVRDLRLSSGSGDDSGRSRPRPGNST
jgi:hypothetical protein